MRAPATKSAKPPVSRPLRVRTSNVFAQLALRGVGDSSSIKRQLRTAANDVYLVPMIRDFTRGTNARCCLAGLDGYPLAARILAAISESSSTEKFADTRCMTSLPKIPLSVGGEIKK